MEPERAPSLLKLTFRQITVGLCAALVGVIAVLVLRTVGAPDPAIVATFGVLIVGSENLGLHLPSAVAVTPSTTLVMAAIVALNYKGTLPGAILVSICACLRWEAVRERRCTVLAFNAAQYGLAGAAAAFTYDMFHGLGITVWAASPFTLLVYLLVNTGLVVVGAQAKSGARWRAVWDDVHASHLSDVVFGVLGFLLGQLYLIGHLVVVVALVAVVVVAHTVFTAITRLRHAYSRIDLLYRFTQRLERSRDEREAIMSILSELRSLLDARTAEVTLVDQSPWRRTTLLADRKRPVLSEGTDEPVAMAALQGSSALATELAGDDPLRLDLESRLGPGSMIVAVRSDSDGGLLGTLAVGDPTDGRTYSQEDLRLFEALASHAAVSLENSRLLGQLRYDSHHDHLTGLPNRTRFNELISDLPKPSAILLIDLDRFKEINDTLGHQHGDLLLMSVARRVTEEVGHRGIVARLGGDEFGVLLPQTGSGDAAQTAVALLAAIEQPFQIGELELEITASIGVAVAVGDDAETALLLQRADVAMYSAKESHSGWELYSSERDHYSPRRLTLAGELRRAIESGELEVHYQPKAELSTGRIRGVEALVRWRHPRYGVIGPDQFIPVAESAGLIRPLTSMVLAEAIGYQRSLRLLGYDLEVAINLSVRSVLDVNLPDQIAQVLAEHGVPASSLTLEITEGSVMADPARTIGILGRLSELGCAISVDDFGTGYSSLSYLKRLPADEVKIDRTFVAGMLANPSDRAIVHSTVDLARNLGLRAVAEGVEDSETWDALQRLGCDYAQGYFVSPALPADAFRSWLLRTQPAVDPRG